MPLINPLPSSDQGGWRPARRDRRDRAPYPHAEAAPFEERPTVTLIPASLTALPSLLEPLEMPDSTPPTYSLRIAFYSEHQPLDHEAPTPGSGWDARA